MTRPNILFIISDQMVAELTSAYGHSIAQTPHLERLAEEGVRFDSAYTPFPLCAPGRACFMSGRHASEIGAWDNGAPLTCDQPTFATYLAAAGYDTVLSGKMHFVGPDQLHGFRQRLTTDIYSSDFGWVKDEWIGIKESRGADFDAVMGQRPRYNAVGYVGDDVHVDRWHTPLSYDEETHFRAVEYLRAQGESGSPDKPFALVASYHHPHEPFWPPQAYWDMYADADVDIAEYPAGFEQDRSQMDLNLNAYHGVTRYDLRNADSQRRLRRAYHALTTYMDDKVGGLLRTLDETGLADNTVVVFASDHGDMLCEREMVQKRCFYEWSARVPLFVRFPDGWRAGATCTTPVSLLDLLPTFNELAGFGDAHAHSGDSLLPIIDGQEADRIVFSQAHEAVGMPCIMARQGRFKYNHIHGYSPQLFDLAADPGEWANLAGQAEHADVEDRLRTAVLDRFGDLDDMHQRNLESLHRRRTIASVMKGFGQTWSHEPGLDHRKGAMQQYLP